ncbi:MAG: PAS domain-containing protein [Ignavibacteria bacterium]|nr:PAS domain-containing protein [Ignavibacteria bacterium]
MKYKVSPNNKVFELREEDFIVSKTDSKGLITYCNKIFIEYAKYTEKELLGSQHNIIRHPDMPRSIFKLLWGTIGQKKEIFAYVKNMSKDGSAYWVIANVTASLDENNSIIGHYSVRRKPKSTAVRAVSDLYKEMVDIERRSGTRDAISASTEYLMSILSKGGKSYEEFVLSL